MSLYTYLSKVRGLAITNQYIYDNEVFNLLFDWVYDNIDDYNLDFVTTGEYNEGFVLGIKETLSYTSKIIKTFERDHSKDDLIIQELHKLFTHCPVKIKDQLPPLDSSSIDSYIVVQLL